MLQYVVIRANMRFFSYCFYKRQLLPRSPGSLPSYPLLPRSPPSQRADRKQSWLLKCVSHTLWAPGESSLSLRLTAAWQNRYPCWHQRQMDRRKIEGTDRDTDLEPLLFKRDQPNASTSILICVCIIFIAKGFIDLVTGMELWCPVF